MSAQDEGTFFAAVDYDPFGEYPPLVRTASTTESQREIWLAANLNPQATLSYNEAGILRLRGQANIDALIGAVQDLVDRHEALRSTFSPDGLTLCIAAPSPISIPVVDFMSMEPDVRRCRFEDLAVSDVETPFDLQRGPLFRARIVLLDHEDLALMLLAHHIVCDGWSYGVMVKELAALYALRLGRPAEPLPQADSFGDYAVAECSGHASQLDEDEKYWLGQFQDPPPSLDLPLDRARPPLRSQRAGREDCTLDSELVTTIRKMGVKSGASMFVTLLASFTGFLHRLTGNTDIVVGIPAAGQSLDGHARLVGHCVNMLPLRSFIDPEQPLSALLKAVRATVLNAYEHQRYTFGTLLKKLPLPRDPSRLPLVSVVFNIDQAMDSERNSFPGLDMEFTTTPRRYENFELFINAAQVGGRLSLECQYNCDMFDVSTIRRWLAGFEAFLRDATVRPEAPLGELDTRPVTGGGMLREDDRDAYCRLNDTIIDYPTDVCLHELIEAQVARTPEQIAIIDEKGALNYRELNAIANRLAYELRGRGAGAGRVVGICMDRSLDMVIGLLAILKSGSAYLPLDPTYPKERLAHMMDDAEVVAVLVQGHTADKLPAGRESIWLRVGCGESAVSNFSSNPPLVGTAGDAAYVIFTSGSTGKPKGAINSHRAIVNRLLWMQDTFKLRADDTVLQKTPFSFDVSVWEFFWPLLAGARLAIARPEGHRDSRYLVDAIRTYSVTTVHFVPSMLQAFLLDSQASTCTSLRRIICSGEALPARVAEDCMASLSASLHNLYGPTEAAVDVTHWRCSPGSGRASVPIGRPVANTQIYILDDKMRLCPVGERGELFIGGIQVGMGYLKRPELTAERFVPDPFAHHPGGRLYRTGDLARLTADGVIEYLGRSDFQVKVRGFRIELGEIEAALTECPNVRSAAVLAHEDRPGDVRLIAYVITTSGVMDEAALRAHLASSLPEFMLPQHFVSLKAFPLTSNGKVDRQALPAVEAPRRPLSAERPATDLEARVRAAFQHHLRRPDIGLEENFFAMGGHSLLAAQLIAALNLELGLAMPMRLVFEAPTVAALANRIDHDRSSNVVASRIPIRPDQQTAPLSLQQQRVWFIEQLQPGNTIFNSPAAHRLRGQIHEAAFERAINEMVRRQPSLRTVIREDGDITHQVVLPEIQVRLFPPEDLSDMPADNRETHLQARIHEMTVETFDFYKGPLFRTRMFRLGPEEHVLVFVVHHILWDGWSFDLFYDEMNAHYEAFRHGQPSPLGPLPVSYGDFAAWQRAWLQGDRLSAEVEHWKRQLQAHSEPLALPADRPRPPRMSNTGITEWLNVSKEMTDRLHEIGRKADATLFMTLYAAFYVFLWKHTGQRDLVVGTPVRARSHAEVEPLMGFFVNALAVRQVIDEGVSFLDLVREVRATSLDAFSHPDVPFEHLVRELKLPRDDSRFPVYQAFFSFQDARRRPSKWGNLSHERFPVFQAGLAEDCSAWFVERSFGLVGSLSLNADIFTPVTVRRYRDRFLTLLQAVAADPHKRIADLEFMAEDERQAIASCEIGIASPVMEPSAPVQSLFEQQAARIPGREAIWFDGQSITYAELDVRANRLAQLLGLMGVGRGMVVGLCLERSPDMITAMLAVLKAGGAYLPLDPRFPASRLAFMTQDSGLGLVLSESHLASRHGCDPGKTLNLDECQGRLGEQLATRPNAAAAAEDCAYVIYTSGSTGKPKGVAVPHRAALNFLHGMLREPGLKEGDRLVAVTTLSFDIAFLELMLPLAVGAQIVLAGQELAMDGAGLRQLIESSKATVMQATPVTWRLLIHAGWRGHDQFRAFCGGEAMSPDLADDLRGRSGEVWNMYGPTETTVWSACWRVGNSQDGIFVGRPILNTTIRVLDARMHRCPLGVPGEIYIGGQGLALGYLNRPELTADCFSEDSRAPGQRLYKTGDLGRWREGGILECLGRTDFQVKVRGHRIELGEIEAVLSRHGSVKQAVVIVREDSPGDVRLVAYYIPARERVDDAALRAHARVELPEYMVPQRYIPVSAFPMTANGKIDRTAFAVPEPNVVAIRCSRTWGPSEKVIRDVWSRILGVSEIKHTDNFFDLGGHSFIALEVIAEVDKAIGKRGTLRDLIFLSLEQIAAIYDQK